MYGGGWFSETVYSELGIDLTVILQFVLDVMIWSGDIQVLTVSPGDYILTVARLAARSLQLVFATPMLESHHIIHRRSKNGKRSQETEQ